jgi:hypothetical protein
MASASSRLPARIRKKPLTRGASPAVPAGKGRSRNGFHCLVGRDWPGAFEPQCFDAEGSETLLKATLLEAELRMKGAARESIERALGEANAAGRLRAPRRAGINYMLSPDNRVPVDDQGTIRPYRAHVMIYVPYLTNADFGVDPAQRPPVFVINEGRPGAYLIVPVPDETLHAHPPGASEK